ncbi:MAG TPA: response regulator [Longimicrobiales bacterium]|nr:response regulator [Longimicrobiales bacterium]
MTTILFVEDQLELRAIHSAYLQLHGFRVLTADDGETGLDVAKLEHPDLIVLDHSLPRLTGLEVARELQKDPAMARIPIVMMTAVNYGAIGTKARAAGCVGFLSKPCTPSRLLQEVQRLTNVAAASR